MPHGKGQKGPAASRVGAEVAGPLHAGSRWRADGPPQGHPASVELQHAGENRGERVPMPVGNDLPQTRNHRNHRNHRQLPLNSLCGHLTLLVPGSV